MLVQALVLLLAPAETYSQQEGGGQSSARLSGKVFGLGAAGAGGKNGMDLAFDGKTDTYFDCVGPPDDFPDACYVGIELGAPSAVGSIRFFPRGVCPGCEYGGPGYTKVCPGSTPDELKDKGACRMLGPEGHRGMFQGAAAQTGPWTTFASIVVKPADGAWTTLQSSDSSTFAFVRYHSPKGGFCNVAEIEFYPPSAWGWALSTVLILGGAAYVAGGVVLGKRGGAGDKGLKAHPHHGRWLMLHGLCLDGVRFAGSRGRQQARGATAGYVSAPGGSRGGGGGVAGAQSAKREKKEKKEKDKREHGKKSSKSSGGGRGGGGGGGSSPPSRARSDKPAPDASAPAPAAAAAGTEAGGGGRWVHVS